MDKENNKFNILITGTPGVGKTSLSMLLVEALNEHFKDEEEPYKYINIGELVLQKKLYTEWNKEYDVPEFDEDKVNEELEPILKNGRVVVDFHSSYLFPEDLIDLVILLRCNNTILYDRLKERGYDDKKIMENIECEIMEVTSEEVRESFAEDKILELYNEQVDQMEENIQKIIERLKQN
jgi:adenylate kinase